MYNKTKLNNKWKWEYKMTTEEMLLQILNEVQGTKQDINCINGRLDKMDERFDKMEKDISDIKDDIDEMKEDITAAKVTASHNGNILERLTDQLSTLNIVDIKYYEKSR